MQPLGQTTAPEGEKRRTWTSRRAVTAHIALAVWFPGCIVATWWQVNIAVGGDDLGWAYSIMWPCFAVFGAVFWWYLVHDDPDTVGARGLRRLQQAAKDEASSEERLSDEDELSGDDLIRLAEEEDDELAQYNRYLADLARRDPPKTWIRR